MKNKKIILMILALGFTLPFLPQSVNAATKTVTSPKKTTKVTAAAKNTPKIKKETNTVITTESKLSYVVLNKNTYFLNSQNKSTKQLAKKGQGYRIYYAKSSGNKIYYGTKQKTWLTAVNTHGTVWYKEDDNNLMILTTDKKGQLSYTLYNPVNIANLVVKHNSYVYDDQGNLQRDHLGTVTLIKKGTKIKGYSQRTINKTKFYITDQGWLKVANLVKETTKKK